MKKITQCINQHVSLESHKEVGEICKPLFDRLNLGIMNFIRVTSTGKLAYLCDNYHWLKHYFLNAYPLIGAFEQYHPNHHNEHVLWTALSDSDPIVTDSRERFNINHGITLIKLNADSCDYFNFGTSSTEASIHEELLKNTGALSQFIDIFYQKAHRLIQKAEISAFDKSQFQDSKKKHAPSTLRNCVYLGPSHNYQSLTHRELECLLWFTQGKSVPEIAIILGISSRTAEKYFENLKIKLNCRTQGQLGFVAAKLGLDRLWNTKDLYH